MKFDGKRVIKKILMELGERELRLVKKSIGSKTLRAAVRLIVDESKQRADLFIPHYWAIYYHDGRGSVSPRSARKLVFFDNPNDDPRLAGGYPVRASQVQRLTREQYNEGLRRNQERARKGGRPFMYVVDGVGPSKPKPFFKRLSQGSAQRAEPIVRKEFERELLAWIDSDTDTKPETRASDFGLRF